MSAVKSGTPDDPGVRAVQCVIEQMPDLIISARKNATSRVHIYLPPIKNPAGQVEMGNGSGWNLGISQEGSYLRLLDNWFQKNGLTGKLFAISYCHVCGGTPPKEPCPFCGGNTQNIPTLKKKPVEKFRVLAVNI